MTHQSGAAGASDVIDWYAAARPLCLARMREAYEPRRHLFSRQLRDARWGDTGPVEAVTSTAICLIGLGRAGVDPGELGVETAHALEAIADSIRSVPHPGALGLALWANAVSDGSPFAAFLGRCGYGETGLRDLIPALTSMELAWLVSGLLHERRRAAIADGLTDHAISALRARQGESGLFFHAERGAALTRRLRRNVANFADQIYSAQALAFAALAGRREEARGAARRCADALLERRGPLHQWWWHYDPRDGAVSRHYPVYSVHQHAMAPMAFLTLAAAGATEYRDRAWPGLDWLGRNELGLAMLDSQAGTIWRDIHVARGALASRLRDASELLGLRGTAQYAPAQLRLNRETRPYEWAWCLLAGAMLTTPPPAGHLA